MIQNTSNTNETVHTHFSEINTGFARLAAILVDTYLTYTENAQPSRKFGKCLPKIQISSMFLPVICFVPCKPCAMDPGLLSSPNADHLPIAGKAYRVGLGVLQCNGGDYNISDGGFRQLKYETITNVQ
jgi:hypothetical protein